MATEPTTLDELLAPLELAIRIDDRVVDAGGALTEELTTRSRYVTTAFDPLALTDVVDGSQDVVVSAGFLETLPTAEAQLLCIGQFARMLRPGAWTAFSLSTDPGPTEPVAPEPVVHSRRAFFRALVGGAPEERARPRASFVPLDALGASAFQAGLELQQIEGSGTTRTLVRATRIPGV